MIRILIVFLLAFAAGPALSREPAPPFEAQAAITEAIGVAREKAYRRGQVDWPSLEARVRARAEGAKDSVDLLPALVLLLEGLADGHSFLQVPDESRAAYRARYGVEFDADRSFRPQTSTFIMRRGLDTRPLALPRGRQARLVTVPKVFGGGAGANAYAKSLYGQLAEAAPTACGYVLDLRGNVGGNVWPMLAGLSPLLGEGSFAGEEDPAGARSFYARLEQGAVKINAGEQKDLTIIAVESWAPLPGLTKAPVALLIDDGVASSGEGVALNFKGRPNTRFFGSRTYGAASSNEGFQLSGGENLVITTAMMTDRNGRTYPGGISPDEAAAAGEGRADDPDDAVIEAAKVWLGRQKACR